MRTVRRLLYSEILGAVLFVTVAFLALFYFIDFVEEIDDVGQGSYSVAKAALYCLMLVPGHLYELLPIAVLIGSIYAMAKLAQSSEFTILRTAGLGPGRALSLLAVLGIGFGALSFALGDVVAPWFDQHANQLRNNARRGDPVAPAGAQTAGAGAWLKDRREAPAGAMPPGERLDTIRVGRVLANGTLEDVQLFEFDADGQLLTRVQATGASVDGRRLRLVDAQVARWRADADGNLPAIEQLAQLDWPSTLTPAVVAAAVSPVKSMSTLNLYRYTSHLSDNEQAAQRHEIQFWKKALNPLAPLVMLALALPFAYLHGRSGGVSLKVFGGILLGISFVLLNNVSTHLGLLRDWTPWIAAAAPSVLYLMMSMAAFSWLVRNR
ncbi:LPS export ABC transporter permease LptG [Rivibacter subsaxonicus]|uniref:Lipopolysaccharide export system permease protein n=1 Tax=Rivibacter subsaxonicus TaxID=457575 RepID=A0A4Q7VAQ6_9BURK|nr:LPS export ABC transporter permease LptG [Rivibacter subsaxonicus]RZT93866.1 lipopolysaccharide export system permease protein [Rivibacter subsaxonicus]